VPDAVRGYCIFGTSSRGMGLGVTVTGAGGGQADMGWQLRLACCWPKADQIQTSPKRLQRAIHVGFTESLQCPVIGPLWKWRYALEDVGPDVVQAPKRGCESYAMNSVTMSWASGG